MNEQEQLQTWADLCSWMRHSKGVSANLLGRTETDRFFCHHFLSYRANDDNLFLHLLVHSSLSFHCLPVM